MTDVLALIIIFPRDILVALQEFFSMGGYGSYIWASYGVTALAMIVLLIATLRGLRSSRIEREQLEAVLQSRRPRRPKKNQPAS